MLHPDALGKPGAGIHFHVCGIAVVDLALTFVAAWFLARWRGWPVWATFAVLFAVGTLVHLVVGVRTTVTKALTQ